MSKFHSVNKAFLERIEKEHPEFSRQFTKVFAETLIDLIRDASDDDSQPATRGGDPEDWRVYAHDAWKWCKRCKKLENDLENMAGDCDELRNEWKSLVETLNMLRAERVGLRNELRNERERHAEILTNAHKAADALRRVKRLLVTWTEQDFHIMGGIKDAQAALNEICGTTEESEENE